MDARQRIAQVFLATAVFAAVAIPAFALTTQYAEAQAVGVQAAATTETAPKDQTTSCWTSWTSVPDVGCIVRSMLSIIGAIPAAIGAWTLTVSGILFNWLIYYTIIIFGDGTNGFLTSGVVDGINLVWTVFRDIANIIIIGMFAFVAISIILGNQKYGEKKLIARVLIVAILINFSLLFTKIIVDASNFVALQFYKAVDLPANEGGSFSVSNGQSQQAQAGIAGRFIQHMGITSAGNVYAAVDKVAINQGVGISILYGLFVGTIFLAAAAVFLYGSFLLISRAILILFLMMTASLAFASYLIPSLSESTYGWGTWWKSLINVSIFAPLLMMFLWATLTISEAFAKGRTGSLGKLVSDPTSSFDMAALFGYLIVLGLLFASMKISSAFATKISGFNFAAMVPALGAGLAFRGLGFLGAQTIGRGGTIAGERFAAAGKEAQANKQFIRAGLLDIAARSFKSAGKKDFNAANTAFGKQLAGIAGLKGAVAGESKGKGFEGWEKKLKENAAEKAGRLSYDKDEIAKMQQKALATSTAAVAEEISKVTGKDVSSVDAQTLKTSIDQMTKAHQETAQAIAHTEKELEKHQTALKTVGSGSPEAEQIQKEIDKKASELADHNSRLAEQSQRIKDAQQLSKSVHTAAHALLPGTIGLGDAATEAKNLKYANAEDVAFNRLTNLPAQLFGKSKADDRIAKKMRKAVDDAEHHRKMKEAMEVWKHTMDEHGDQKAKPSQKQVEKAVKKEEKHEEAGSHDDGHGDHH